MRHLIVAVVAGGALLTVAACGDSGKPAAAPSAASAPAASLPASLSPQELVANTAAACGVADTIYANLDATAREELGKAVTASMKGDDAAAAKALQKVTPIFKAASVTFQKESDNARDPNVKDVLKTLSDEFAQAAAITTIDDFEKIDTEEAETTLKTLCSESGVQLKNFHFE